jgi:uncharacterized protein YggE
VYHLNDMKLLFACAFALCLVFSFAQDENLLFRDQMKTYGTGVVLVPINRAALTITATGTGSAAADAVTAATNLQSMMNDTLSSSFTIFDVRSGGFFLMPVYDGSSLSFMARRSLSVVVPADELADVIDSMIGLGASNITFLFVPDFTAVEAAQAQALKLAVVDGLWKAQAVLDTIGHCARNITTIEIKNPALEIPTITFNLFANMGNTFNRQISNVNMPSTSDMSGNANANANLNMRADNNIVMLGAGSPSLRATGRRLSPTSRCGSATRPAAVSPTSLTT